MSRSDFALLRFATNLVFVTALAMAFLLQFVAPAEVPVSDAPAPQTFLVTPSPFSN